MKEFRFIGTHPEELGGGRPVEPGEFTGLIDPDERQNARLIADGLLIEVADGAADAAVEGPILLAGEALKERARELDIKGRASMTADELRAAVVDTGDTTDTEGGND